MHYSNFNCQPSNLKRSKAHLTPPLVLEFNQIVGAGEGRCTCLSAATVSPGGQPKSQSFSDRGWVLPGHDAIGHSIFTFIFMPLVKGSSKERVARRGQEAT